MKLVVFNNGRIGALQEKGSVIDLNYAYAAYLKKQGEPRPQVKADAIVPADLLAFIQEGKRGLDEAQKAVSHVESGNMEGPAGEKLLFTPEEVKLRAPLPSKATKIAMAGANFYDHSLDAARSLRGDTETTIEDLKMQVKEGLYPVWGFWKHITCVIGQEEKRPTLVEPSA